MPQPSSKAEQGIKSSLTGDIKCIRDTLLGVLQEYQELVKSFRQLMSTPDQPYAAHSAQALLQRAWASVKEATGTLTSLTQTLLDRGELLEAEVSKKDKHPWLHALVNHKVPQGFVATGFLSTFGGAIYNSAAADNIEHHVNGAAAVQAFWAFSGVIFGTTFGGLIAYYGCEAHIYQAGPRQDTKEAVEAIQVLLQQFSRDIGRLKTYWSQTHNRELYRQGAWGGPIVLREIVSKFDEEIEKYSKMTTCLDQNVPMKGTVPLLSPSDLYEQHHRILPSN